MGHPPQNPTGYAYKEMSDLTIRRPIPQKFEGYCQMPWPRTNNSSPVYDKKDKIKVIGF
jgi:hypothetical protein